mmetsp:Transcript_136543/g.345762  ORF Transcript_136543/g.345762 Transcript_136543/m.345762 type:complete len:164 (-) Transcript_136543:321-812(-)
MFLLELCCKLPHQALVQSAPTHFVRLFAHHCQLAAHKLDDGNREDGDAHRAKCYRHRLLWVEVVRTVDAICQSCGGMLIHDAKHLEVYNLCRIQNGLPLHIREGRRYRDDHVSHLAFAPLLSDVPQLAQVHGCYLNSGHLPLLSLVHDLVACMPVGALAELGG